MRAGRKEFGDASSFESLFSKTKGGSQSCTSCTNYYSIVGMVNHLIFVALLLGEIVRHGDFINIFFLLCLFHTCAVENARDNIGEF